MIKINRTSIEKCIIHKVANKYNSGNNSFSEDLIQFDEESYDLILPFLLKSFQKETQSYRFKKFGPVEQIIDNMFVNTKEFIEDSIKIVNHLYAQSDSAQIKTGDVLIVYFEGIEYKDVLTDAIGVFKIENKINFFQTYADQKNFDVVVQKGISTKKLDKGCLILNTTDTEGTVVLSVDNNNYDTLYWKNNFLNIEFAKDKNLHTQNYLELCNEFSKDVLKSEYGNQIQANFLSGVVDFFKENELVNFESFVEDTLDNKEQQEQFKEFKKSFETIKETTIQDNFEISTPVFKKEKKKFKTIIKLDTNFEIKIDVDDPDAAKEYLERGFDDDKKMGYYKIYFNNES